MNSLERIFPGNSELAGRMRALDWSTTGLGPPDSWPERLLSAVSICLLSRFPIVMWWGPKMSMFYNDAYISFLGRVKHPAMLGRSFAEAWAEIWPTIGPMLEGVRKSGEASWSEDILMFFDRHLPKEEVYVTFSFSPLIGEGGEVDGIFCACTETTEKLVGSRRIESLRRLGIRALEAPTVDEACHAAVDALATNPQDVTFSSIYVIDAANDRLTLRASAGLPDSNYLPRVVSLVSEEHSAWPLAAVLKSHRAAEVDLAGLGLAPPGSPWPEPTERAIVLPLFGAARERVVGLLIAGVSPRRVLDAQYRTYFELVAGHVSTAIADAQAFEAERRRAEALAEIDQAKTTFFSNVSHEFRTPLTLMLAPIEDTLANLSRWPAEAIRGQLETVHRNALRLLKLVNTLLDFSRIEAGRVQASFEPVDLAAVTTELASVFRAAIERAGLTLTVRCEPLPEPVYVDREMWEKVVLNLLSNAFKFTFEGGIEVVQRVVDDRVELTVRDTGIGVAPEELPRLFERFHRIESVKARTYEGSGIGLSLVQELVRIHAAEIRVDSEPGKGTQFTVSLHRGVAHLPSERIGAPRSVASTATQSSAFIAEALHWHPDAADGAAKPPAATAVQCPRILIADDNADMREYLTRLLAERWVVESVADGEAALTRVREARFDLILTDIMMPRLDGFGLLKALRADPTFKSLPVIMLSARAGEESRIEGLEFGADDYLIKPFLGREVVARVETHLKLSTRRALDAENAALTRLHEVSARLISEDALPTLLEAVVDAAIAVSNARMGNVQLNDAATDCLRIVAQRGFDRPFLDYFASVHAGESAACGEARRLHERVIVDDVSQSPIFLNQPSLAVLEAAGVRAVQSTPLVARDGRLLGIVSTHWTEPHRPDEGTLRILDILTRVVADLIEHRQREDALRSSEATVRELRAAESASAQREIRGYQERIQQMSFDAIVTEERERRRIAADLHDGVGQSLALSQIKLTSARQEIIGAPREAIDQVIALIGETIASARTLTFDLSPPILYDLGLKEALSWLAEKLQENHGTRIEIADDGTEKPLDDVTAALVFRATRELLMNVVKHSRAPTAKVSLRRVESHLAVTVEDTGVGFHPDDTNGRWRGFGLLSVREQIHRLEGSTEVISAPGQGVRVSLSVPIRPKRNQAKAAEVAWQSRA